MRWECGTRWLAALLLAAAMSWAGCSGDSGSGPDDDDGDGEDGVPSIVNDLAVAGVTSSTATLRWTAPHGGSPTLLAYAYDMRLSPAAITEATWGAAIELDGEPAPLPMGMEQKMVVTGLPADTTLYFAMKSRNQRGVSSAVSNCVPVVIPPLVEIQFPDSSLESIIREILANPTDPLYSADLAAITAIHAEEKGITSLDGLENCVSLRVLNLRGNSIASLAPLTNLTLLNVLGVSDNQLTDIQALAGMTTMQEIYIGSNQIADISPLQNMTNLNVLYLNGNPIADPGPLATLTRLNHLFLGGTGIDNLDPLAGLVYLANLDVGYNGVTDLAPLVANQGLGSGDEIWVWGNPLTEVSRNEHIPALRARGAIVHDQ